ncbi:MAG: hypothetical protein ABEH78_04490 [Haloferacaceae archaeon]
MAGEKRNDGPDLGPAVERFLDGATAVYGEYEQGYMDADAALTALERHVEELRRAAEGGEE